jgi:hypothetical protein
MEPKIGTRLRCATCGAEAILTKVGENDLTCCDRPLEPAAGSPA